MQSLSQVSDSHRPPAGLCFPSFLSMCICAPMHAFIFAHRASSQCQVSTLFLEMRFLSETGAHPQYSQRPPVSTSVAPELQVGAVTPSFLMWVMGIQTQDPLSAEPAACIVSKPLQCLAHNLEYTFVTLTKWSQRGGSSLGYVPRLLQTIPRAFLLEAGV